VKKLIGEKEKLGRAMEIKRRKKWRCSARV